MRPINKGSNPTENGIEIEFKEYSHSRKYLIDRLGRFCSYCENSINANLAIEHVQPKSSHLDLELKWSNFLLACTNCNSTKGKEDINLDEYIFPDTSNSFVYFDYDFSGIVKVKNNLSAENQKKALKTIELVGLDKCPPRVGTIEWKKASDSRFEKRLETVKITSDYFNIYNSASEESKKILILCFKDIIKRSGFWSVWIQTFNSIPEVLKEITHCIKGTNELYFQK